MPRPPRVRYTVPLAAFIVVMVAMGLISACVDTGPGKVGADKNGGRGTDTPREMAWQRYASHLCTILRKHPPKDAKLSTLRRLERQTPFGAVGYTINRCPASYGVMQDRLHPSASPPATVRTPTPSAPPSNHLQATGPRLEPDLAAAGLTVADVRKVAAVADADGYGGGAPLTWSLSQQLAGVALDACQMVANGEATWADKVADDVSVGAPPQAARDFYGYLRNTFCPKVHN